MCTKNIHKLWLIFKIFQFNLDKKLPSNLAVRGGWVDTSHKDFGSCGSFRFGLYVDANLLIIRSLLVNKLAKEIRHGERILANYNTSYCIIQICYTAYIPYCESPEEN